MPILELTRLSDIWEPAKSCRYCRFVYRREAGYFFGAIIPVLPILSLLTGALIAGAYYVVARPVEVEDALPYGAMGVALGFISLYRVAIAIYIAFDHTIDPPSVE